MTIIEEIREALYKMTEEEQRELLALITSGKFSAGISPSVLNDHVTQINADSVTLDTMINTSYDSHIEISHD